jgi:hypothetical protein
MHLRVTKTIDASWRCFVRAVQLRERTLGVAALFVWRSVAHILVPAVDGLCDAYHTHGLMTGQASFRHRADGTSYVRFLMLHQDGIRPGRVHKGILNMMLRSPRAFHNSRAEGKSPSSNPGSRGAPVARRRNGPRLASIGSALQRWDSLGLRRAAKSPLAPASPATTRMVLFG